MVSARTLYRHKYFTVVNAVGLALGMSVSLFLITMLAFINTYDNFHVHQSSIYRITTRYKSNGREFTMAMAPAALAEKLRTLPETKVLPVIFLTASKDPELRQKVMDLGAAGLLEKPYQTDELLLMINYAFERPARARYAGPCARPAIPENQRTTHKKILLVEDDTNIAKSLRIRLEAAGYEALLAEDGLVAVNVAVKNRPDLVLLDISMPAGSGFTVAQRIQTAIPTPTPIIFLTASKRPEFRQKAEELGAIGFFEKPFEADELLATIKKALARGPAELPGPRSVARGM